MSALVSYGDCSGTTEGRLFWIDNEGRSTDTIVTGFWPGKILVYPDGTGGAVMAHRNMAGLHGSAPPGLVLIEGTTATLVDLGDHVWDFDGLAGGWIVAAGSAGAWRVHRDGQAQSLWSSESYCVTEAFGRSLVCSGNEVKVLDSSGTLVGNVLFSDPPHFVDGNDEIAVVLYGTNAAIMRDGAPEDVYSLGEPGITAWASTFTNDVWIAGYSDTHWIRGTEPTVVTYEGGSAYADAAFQRLAVVEEDLHLEWKEFVHLVSPNAGWAIVDLQTGDAEYRNSAAVLVETMRSGDLFFARDFSADRLGPGDVIPEFFTVFNVPANQYERWDLVLNE